jgi:hypothetical protein
MLKHALTYTIVTAFFALSLLSCQKNKIKCETDVECEQLLVGLWENNYTFSPPNDTRYEFLSDGTFKEYRPESDSNGNRIWEVKDDPKVSYDDTLHYQVNNSHLITRYGAGKYKGDVYFKKKIERLHQELLKLKNDNKYKRIK